MKNFEMTLLETTFTNMIRYLRNFFFFIFYLNSQFISFYNFVLNKPILILVMSVYDFIRAQSIFWNSENDFRIKCSKCF